MSYLRVLDDGPGHGHRGSRGLIRRRVTLALLTLILGAVVLLAFMAARASGPGSIALRSPARAAAPVRSAYGTFAAPAGEQVQPPGPLRLRSGLLFDVRTGAVLWQRDPDAVVPIASLTKMMTALLVVEHAREGDRVLITPAVVHYSGSGIGLLPLGKRVSMLTLLYGLLLPSGNDAAIALAQRVAGTQGRFIAMMNAQARSMGLTCTHFTTVSGIVDQDNHSCAADLALLAHAVLQHPLLAQIVGSRSAVLPFPTKGGKLYLYNNNPLLLSGFRGADGVKTGYTNASGQCLVATARRRGTWLGVVLLHSANAAGQAQGLLNAGFLKLGGPPA